MMRFLRSQSQTVLVFLLAMIGLGFLFYGNVGSLMTSSTGHGSNDYGSIDGDSLTGSDLFDAIRITKFTLILQGRGQMLEQQGANAGRIVDEEAWRQLLLQHEADKLHIDVSNEELASYIRNQPFFWDPKTQVFSPEVYQSRIAQLQGVFRIPSDSGPDPLASTRAMVENIYRQELRSQATWKALFGTIRTSAGDVTNAFSRAFGPATVSIITFDPKTYLSSVTVTPDEIANEYKTHPENPAYRTKEQRKVDYVIFPLTPDQAKLPDNDKTKAAALDALEQKALNFALTFQPDPTLSTQAPPDFITEAKKEGLTPVTTDFFTVDTPPAGLPPSPAFNNAAFDLTKDDPVSKVIELGDGVAVLHLNAIEPSDLRPLDEVKDQIQQQLQQAKAKQAASTAAQDAAQALQGLLTQGTDFSSVVAKLGYKIETLPPIVPAKVQEGDMRLEAIANILPALDPGKISPPIPMEGDNSIILIYLNHRDKPDQAGMTDFEGRYRQSQDEQIRSDVYLDWANWMSRRPGTHKPPDLDQYGTLD